MWITEHDAKSKRNNIRTKTVTNTKKQQIVMDGLLNVLGISAKKEIKSRCCMMGKTMSLRCHFLAANGWRLRD